MLSVWQIIGVVLLVLIALAALVLAIMAFIRTNQLRNGTFIVREDQTQQELLDSQVTALLFAIGKYRKNIQYSSTTGVFKVCGGGIYNVAASFAISPAPSINLPVKAYVLVNGTTNYGASQQQTANGFLVISFDTNIPLQDGDTFQIVGLSEGAGDVTLAPSTAEPTRVSVAKSTYSLC